MTERKTTDRIEDKEKEGDWWIWRQWPPTKTSIDQQRNPPYYLLFATNIYLHILNLRSEESLKSRL